MLSVAELKKEIFMSFEVSFSLLIEAVDGIGSFSSIPVAFLDTGFDYWDLFIAAKSCYIERICSQFAFKFQTILKIPQFQM